MHNLLADTISIVVVSLFLLSPKSGVRAMSNSCIYPSDMNISMRSIPAIYRDIKVFPKTLIRVRWNSSITPVAAERPSNPLSIKRPEAQSVARRTLLESNDVSVLYPRICTNALTQSFTSLRKKYSSIEPGTNLKDNIVTIRGRIKSKRDVSSRLVFYDLVQDGVKLQVVYNYKSVGGNSKEFHDKVLSLSVGDSVSVTGYIGKTPAGELSAFATSTIELLAPCLHVLPTDIQDIEKRFQHRHVDLFIRPEATQTLRLRADIIQYIRQSFISQDFIEVQTPIMGDAAGGAIAKPFLTEATVYRGRKLALRIAPELWLKRLVVGGLERIFEIGTQFRNEGIDHTHNPEFTTCEFYQAYANLEDLISFTEKLLEGLSAQVKYLKTTKYTALPQLEVDFTTPLKRIEFIPALEAALGEALPDLSHTESATTHILSLFERRDIPVPAHPTLPRLLDKLSSTFLEPQCSKPTFITHHPECLSPLSKSTVDAKGHRISARVELFIHGKELINAYEEENSPSEQRRKFLDQFQWKNAEESATIGDKKAELEERLADEAFVSALEWGLPPTAGWGLGVDRLVMMFSGAERIGDVLSFGGLRGVMGQGGSGATQNVGTVNPRLSTSNGGEVNKVQ